MNFLLGIPKISYQSTDPNTKEIKLVCYTQRALEKRVNKYEQNKDISSIAYYIEDDLYCCTIFYEELNKR